MFPRSNINLKGIGINSFTLDGFAQRCLTLHGMVMSDPNFSNSNIVKENKDGTYKVLFDKKAWEDEDPEAENAYSQKEDRYLNYIPRKEIKFMSRKKGENISIDIKNTKLTVK